MERVDSAEMRRRFLKRCPDLLHTGPRNLPDYERQPNTRVQRQLTPIKENLELIETLFKSSEGGVNTTANIETPTQVEDEKWRQSQVTVSEAEDDTHSLSSGPESELRSLNSDDDGLSDEDIIILPDEPRIPALEAYRDTPYPFHLRAASKTSGKVSEVIPFMDQSCKELQEKEAMWAAAKQETLRVIQQGLVALQRDMDLCLERLSRGLDSDPDLNDWRSHAKDRQEESNPGRADGCLRGLRKKLFRRKQVEIPVEGINMEERQSEVKELELACKRLQEEMVGRITKAWDAMAMEKLARDKVLITEREKAAQCFSRACWGQDETRDRLSETSQSPMSPGPYNAADNDDQTTFVVPFNADNEDDDFRSFYVPSPMVPPPDIEYFPYRRSPRLPPIMNLSESGKKLLTGGAVVGVAPAPQKVKGKKIKKAGKKQVKKEKEQQQETTANEIKKEVHKPGKKSLKERIIRWLLRKLE